MSAVFFENPADELYVIGITGTKGKTTTALTIYSVMNACGLKCGYIGSNGIDFGDFHFETSNTTPESYDLHQFMREMRLAGVKYLAMEVSSQALYISSYVLKLWQVRSDLARLHSMLLPSPKYREVCQVLYPPLVVCATMHRSLN